jgi:hypothetical protein
MRASALLVLGGLLLGLVLGEAALWILDIPQTGPFFQEWKGPRFKLMCYDRNDAGTADIDLRDDAQRAQVAPHLPQPAFDRNWRKTPFAIRVDYNPQGFRDREFRPKEPGVFRIVVVGDSYTYGHGLPEGLSWPRQLESLLRRRLPERRIEVYNCGYHGENLNALVRVMKSALRDWEPDLLIYGYFLNDPQHDSVIRPDVNNMMELDWQYVTSGPGFLSLGERRIHTLRSLALGDRILRMRRMAAATVNDYKATHEGQSWDLAVRQILDVKAAADGRGCRFLVVALPLIWRIHDGYPFGPIHAKLGALAAEHHIEFVDGLPYLVPYTDAQLYIHPKDRHPNGPYTRLVAEALAPAALPQTGGAPPR